MKLKKTNKHSKGGIIMEIKVFGSGCDKCVKLYDALKELIAEKGIEAELVKVEDLIEIVKAGIMTTPAITVDGKVVLSGGGVPSKDKLEKLITK
jgi:small redox-active disulfide protein 2